MKERPIIFTPENAGKIAREEKTQTRRVIDIPPGHNGGIPYEIVPCADGRFDVHYTMDNPRFINCLYGSIGDHIWVKEAWYVGKPHDDRNASEIWAHLMEIGKGVTVIYKGGGWKSVCPFQRSEPEYKSDELVPSWHGRYRHARSMPRWASRTLVEITEIRAQRVQDIGEDDAKAEGAKPWEFGKEQQLTSGERGAASPYRGGFACLWDSINGDLGFTWKSNPFVWAVTFRKV